MVSLITNFPVQTLEPHGHLHHGFTIGIWCGVAAVNIHHVERLNEVGVEILVRRIERLINFEGATGFGNESAPLGGGESEIGSADDRKRQDTKIPFSIVPKAVDSPSQNPCRNNYRFTAKEPETVGTRSNISSTNSNARNKRLQY